MAGYPFDLGTYTRPVSTASPAAQAWFDGGLLWSYGFNHEEAVRCFELAVEHDPGCALAHWGIAYAAGPNYNKDWDAFDAVDLHASLRRAHAAPALVRGAVPGHGLLVFGLHAVVREHVQIGLQRVRRSLVTCQRQAQRGHFRGADMGGAMGAAQAVA